MKKYHLSVNVFGLLLVTIVSASCDNHKHNAKGHSHATHSHSAHESENKRSIDEIAQMFESPERDSVQQPQKVLQYLGDLKGKSLVDIGAGTGYFSMKFAGNGANVIATDVSDEFQHYLKKRIEKDKISNIELRKTPYDSPLLKDREADIVFIANTYHHIENRTAYFSKVKEGIKAGGELIVVDYFSVELPKEVIAPPAEMRVSIDQVVFELRKAGFSSFEVETNLLPYHYIIKAR